MGVPKFDSVSAAIRDELHWLPIGKCIQFKIALLVRHPVDRLAWINALREKHSAFKSKENSYWENTVRSNSSNPKKLWRSVSTILGEPAKQSANLASFSASDFLDFLEQKVESVRSDTAGSAPPSFSSTTCTFDSFSLCSQELVRKVIGGAASKSCELDPAPTFLIKEFLEILLPFLTRLCNASLQEGRLPSSQTTAIVTPALKKPSLDPSDMKNYRPISNLSFMSKVVERIVVRQLSEYFTANSLLPKFQSGFRRHHSTESALLRVLSDIFSAMDRGEVSLLALLDVSAAFDTVDHSILLNRLSIFVRNIGLGVRLDAILHRRSYTDGSLRWFGLKTCSVEIWNCPGISTAWARSCTSCTQRMFRNLWNRSVLESISMPMTPSFTILAGRQMLQYWQPVLRASLRPWGTGCRQTGSDWTQIRHSSSGSEQATSWTFFRSIPYLQMKLSTT